MFCPSCGQPNASNQCRTCGVMSCGEHAVACPTCLGFACPRHERDGMCVACKKLVNAFVHGLGFSHRGAVKAAREAITENPHVLEFDYRNDRGRRPEDELLYERKSGNRVVGFWAFPRTGSRMVLPMCWTCCDCGTSNGNTGAPCGGCGALGNRIAVPGSARPGQPR